MSEPGILVAGIGNIFLGDDAFGVEVARRLMARPQPDAVRIVDFGIRGVDLAFALLDGYRSVLLIDTLSRGGAPGTLHLLELNGVRSATVLTPHAMVPSSALDFARAMGAGLENIHLLGCEPLSFGPEREEGGGLSEPVAAAVGEAVVWVEAFVSRQLEDGPATVSIGPP